MMESKRLDYIDVLRALACFLVVLTHSALPCMTDEDVAYIVEQIKKSIV